MQTVGGESLTKRHTRKRPQLTWSGCSGSYNATETNRASVPKPRPVTVITEPPKREPWDGDTLEMNKPLSRKWSLG